MIKSIAVVIVVLLLLSSADMVFYNLFKFLPNISKNFSISEIIGRLFMMAVFFLYFGSSILYLKEEFSKANNHLKKIY